MSEAKASKDLFGIAVCSQCLQHFPKATAREARHAVPCGHVFCKDCLVKVETEQKTGKPACCRAGCERELAPVAEFAACWVAQRAERIRIKHQSFFPDQSNVGDLPPPTCTECDPDQPHLATHRCESCGDGVYFCTAIATLHPKMKASKGHVIVALETTASLKGTTEPAWNLCTQHMLPIQVVEASSKRPLCAECLAGARGNVMVQTLAEAITALESAQAASSAETATQKTKLAEPTFTADEFRARMAKWSAEETARIRAWEEREVKHVHTVADEAVQLVQDVGAHRIEVGASLITQRMGLRASLEEFDHALSDLPSDPASQLNKKRAVYADRKQLCELLAGNKIAVSSAHDVIQWAELPVLSAEFDQKGAGNGGLLASAVWTAAKAALIKARARVPKVPPPESGSSSEEKAAPPADQTLLTSPKDWRDFPVLPKLDAAKRLRSISMKYKPNVFVGLGDDTVVVGSEDMAPLQVWDLTKGNLVREFEGQGRICLSMTALPGGRVAASWNNGTLFVVAVFDASTGKRLQELTGFSYNVAGLAFVDGHLLTMCFDRNLRVWSQDSAGRLTEKSKFMTPDTMMGSMTVLSPSTVAMSLYNPGRIEIFDWKAGKHVRTLSGFGGGSAFAHALLSDGRFVAGDGSGKIRVGSVDNWSAATVIDGSTGIISMLAGKDGSFVSTDFAGNTKIWRNGTCEVTLSGCFSSSAYYGFSLAVIGRRLVVVGESHTFLVSD